MAAWGYEFFEWEILSACEDKIHIHKQPRNVLFTNLS